MEKNILTINAGSSSIKFALYQHSHDYPLLWSGKIDRIGLSGTTLLWRNTQGQEEQREVIAPDASATIEILSAFLAEHINLHELRAVGHRFVHGMDIAEHALITDELLARLRTFSTLDPEHTPLALAIVESLRQRYPELPQVACFDNVFHHDMPRVAQLLPLPRRFEAKGMRRYGFHGLSCTYLMEELRRVDPERANGKVIILHLGSGASVTAIMAGKSIDTSMGFSPASGIPMSSRSGDVDPGALLQIMKTEQLSLDALLHLINHESGLLGVSETTADMHDLLDRESSDVRAKEAIDLFCYEAKKRIGAYVAVLGGVETIIFSGGIGAVAPRIRARICFGLETFGVIIDESENQRNGALISSTLAPVSVRVMQTDEERIIAHIVGAIILS